MEAGRRFHDLAAAAGNERHSSDRNPDPVFSIPRFGIGKSLITGSRRDFRDSGIRDSSVLNPGIKKTGTGLQALDYTNSPLGYIKYQSCHVYGKLTASTAHSVMIVVMQSTESRNKLSCRRETARRICAKTMPWLTPYPSL